MCVNNTFECYFDASKRLKHHRWITTVRSWPGIEMHFNQFLSADKVQMHFLDTGEACKTAQSPNEIHTNYVCWCHIYISPQINYSHFVISCDGFDRWIGALSDWLCVAVFFLDITSLCSKLHSLAYSFVSFQMSFLCMNGFVLIGEIHHFALWRRAGGDVLRYAWLFALRCFSMFFIDHVRN